MTPLKFPKPEKLILNTISYFSFFGFSPHFDEIFTFYPKKISKKQLAILLKKLVLQKKLVKRPFVATSLSLNIPFSVSLGQNDNLEVCNNLNKSLLEIKNSKLKINLYTLPQYPNLFDMTIQRRKNTWKKLTSIYRYIEVVKKIPFIQFAGLTGSASMGNCKITDDMDLFIITRAHFLFIGRFFAIILSHIFNVRKGRNSVCLNLFFDESNIAIQKSKQTSYVAHEVLQMKPVFDKKNTYARFLKSNKWVYKFFPNSSKYKVSSRKKNQYSTIILNTFYLLLSTLLQPFELMLRIIQLRVIRRNKTSLILSPTQLWLFKRDFEKKVENRFL